MASKDIPEKMAFFELPIYRGPRRGTRVGVASFCTYESRTPEECMFFVRGEHARPRPVCPEHPDVRMAQALIYLIDGREYRVNW
jgi:hypothetical protein